jgi:hypothetical protein
VRVYLPSWEQWEKRSGSSFGFRLDCEAHGVAPTEGWLTTRKKQGWHQYWPGMFFVLRRQEDGYEKTHAAVLIRADADGHEVDGPLLGEPGWYTIGMSVTPDGRVHYYLREGVEDLQPADRIATHTPYGLKCEKFNLMFFNIVNHDDGQTWSTPWIIDDPAVYYIPKDWTLADVRRYNLKAKRKSNEAKLAGTAQPVVPASHVAEAEAVFDAGGNDRALPRKPFILRR